MSTLFVGRLGKGQAWIAAAPQIASGFAQAGDALRQYEKDRQDANKEQILKASIAAKIAGGWSNLSQDTKNELPKLFGVDFNRDPITGDVQIDQSLDQLLEDARRKRYMADPELAAQDAEIQAGLMSKRPHPAELEMLKTKLEGELGVKRYSADLRAGEIAVKDSLARSRLAMQHSLGLERIYANNALKGAKEDSFSGIYAGPKGEPISETEKVQLEQGGEDTTGYKALTMKEVKPFIDSYKAKATVETQASLRRKRDLDYQKATQELASTIASNPIYMGTLKRYREQLATGDPNAKQTRMELNGLASSVAMDAGVDEANYSDTIFGLSKFFQDTSGVDSLLAAATKRKVEAATEPSNTDAADPNIFKGEVGGVPFTFKRTK